MSERKTGPEPDRPKVSRLAIAAAVVSAVFLVLTMFLGVGMVVPGLVGFVFVVGLAAGGLWETVERRDWRGALLSMVAVLLLVVCFLMVYCELRKHYRAAQIAHCYTILRNVQSATQRFVSEAAQVPETVEDLVRAGLLHRDRDLCPLINDREELRRQGVSTYVLAPLDVRFFGRIPRSDWSWRGALLCAYCSVAHHDNTVERAYVSLDGAWQSMPIEQLRAWEEAQREAIGWLDDDFPLHDLEQIAKDQRSRRGEMASVILGYRQARLGETLTEDVRR